MCEACPDGTFNAATANAPSCATWTVCESDTWEAQPGTAEADRVCATPWIEPAPDQELVGGFDYGIPLALHDFPQRIAAPYRIDQAPLATGEAAAAETEEVPTSVFEGPEEGGVFGSRLPQRGFVEESFLETLKELTTVSIHSSNPDVISHEDVFTLFTEEASELRIACPNTDGETEISVTVRDGDVKATASFHVQVEFNSMRVSISPSAAVDAGAKWRVDTGDWHDVRKGSGNLKSGSHVVEFKDVPGFRTPEPIKFRVFNNKALEIEGDYSSAGAFELTKLVEQKLSPGEHRQFFVKSGDLGDSADYAVSVEGAQNAQVSFDSESRLFDIQWPEDPLCCDEKVSVTFSVSNGEASEEKMIAFSSWNPSHMRDRRMSGTWTVSNLRTPLSRNRPPRTSAI